MKTALCLFFLALTELCSAFVITSPLDEIYDLRSFLDQCGQDRTCIRILRSSDSICGDWSQFRRCMVNARCPKFVMDSAGEQIKERIDPNCTEMAADGQVCHKIQDLYSCLMNVPKSEAELCQDLWPLSEQCFVNSGCPNDFILEYKMFLDYTRKDCDKEDVKPNSASRTTPETSLGEYQNNTEDVFDYTKEEPRKPLAREYQNDTDDIFDFTSEEPRIPLPREYLNDTNQVFVYTTEEPRKLLFRENQNDTEAVLVHATNRQSETPTHGGSRNETDNSFVHHTDEPRDFNTSVTVKTKRFLPKKLYFKLQKFVQSSYSVWDEVSESNVLNETITDGHSFDTA